MGVGQKIFTISITNTSLVIDTAHGVTQLSVLCTTATAGTITGTALIGGTSSAAMNIGENTSVTVGTSSGFPIEALTITAPAACTLEITAAMG